MIHTDSLLKIYRQIEEQEKLRKILITRLKSLEMKIRSQYENDQEGLSQRNLGDELNVYDDEVSASRRDLQRDDQVRDALFKVKNMTLQFMRERLRCEDDRSILERKINELDKFGISLLHKAVAQGRIDDVALLVAHGADPSLVVHGADPFWSGTAWDFVSRQTSFPSLRATFVSRLVGLSHRQAREMRDLLDLHAVMLRNPRELILCSSLYWLHSNVGSEADSIPMFITLETLMHKHCEEILSIGNSEFASLWLHLTSTNVSESEISLSE